MKKGDIGVLAFFCAIGVIFIVIAFFVKSTVAKWVFGALAVLVIGFAIFLLIDSIVKKKRSTKALNKIMDQSVNIKDAVDKQEYDKVFEMLAGAMKEAASKPDFAQRMKEMDQKRDSLFIGQRTEDVDYGFSFSNPIMTSTISASDKYLSKLRTMDGESFTWKRTMAMCMRDLHGVKNVMVDEYQLYLNGTEYEKIYICPYGHTSSIAPQGMKLSEE